MFLLFFLFVLVSFVFSSFIKSKEHLEQEAARLKAEMEKLHQRYQSAHDKSVEAQARVSELVDRLEKAENSSMMSTQHLVNTSANIHTMAKSKVILQY